MCGMASPFRDLKFDFEASPLRAGYTISCLPAVIDEEDILLFGSAARFAEWLRLSVGLKFDFEATPLRDSYTISCLPAFIADAKRLGFGSAA